MKKETLSTLIKWIKRLLGVVALVAWISVIVTISKSPLPFGEQAPYCMGSTMLIFMILSGFYKGLEYWEHNIKEI